MGYYLDPPDMEKEDWLTTHGEVVINQFAPSDELWKAKPEGKEYVVLLDNGPFTAAGFCYCENELREFLNPFDQRFKILYIVPAEALFKLSPIFQQAKEEADRQLEQKL